MIRQLLHKELRLQRSNAMFTIGVILLWAMMMVLSVKSREMVPGFSTTWGGLLVTFGSFVLMGVLIAVLPIMIGAATVAEERKIEVLDWQLSLPVSRRLQWGVKATVALGMSLVLGLLASVLQYTLALAISRLGGATLATNNNGAPAPLMFRGLLPAIYAPLAAAVGMYTSSVSRDPYRALMGGGILLFLCFWAQSFVDPALTMFPVAYAMFPMEYLNTPVQYKRIIFMTLFALLLGFVNFRLVGWRTRRVICQALVGIVFVNMCAWYGMKGEFGMPKWTYTKFQPWEVAPTPLPNGTLFHSGIKLTKLFGHFMGQSDGRYPGTYDRSNSIVIEPQVCRLPQTDKLLLLLRNDDDTALKYCPFPNETKGAFFNFPSYTNKANGRYVTIDLATGAFREFPGMWGSLASVGKAGGLFSIDQVADKNYILGKGPFPIPRSAFDWLGLGTTDEWLPPYLNSRVLYGRIPNLGIGLQPSSISYSGLFWVATKYSDLDEQKKRYRNHSSVLVRMHPDFRLDIVDEVQKGENAFYTSSYSYPTSENGKWFARDGVSSGPMMLYSIDRSSTFTLGYQGYQVYVSPPNGQDWAIPRFGIEPGMKPATLTVSPDGCHLAYVQYKTQVVMINGKAFDTGFPFETEIMSLDLATGKQTHVGTIRASARSIDAYGSWFFRNIASKRKDLGQAEGQEPRPGLFPSNSGMGGNFNGKSIGLWPMSWSRDNKLAVLSDVFVSIYKPGADGTYSESQANVQMCGAENLYFCSDKSIALWGPRAVYRLDLP